MSFFDYDVDTKSDRLDKLSIESGKLGMDIWDHSDPSASRGDHLDKYGICKSCNSFACVQYELDGEIAYCWKHEARLSGNQRIVKCTNYAKRGQMTLQEMNEIAWDLSDMVHHKPAGFHSK